MRVLLIDDEKELVTTLSERLELRRIKNDWATSAKDGLELAQKKHYDWLVVDLKMPGLGGFETIKATRKISPKIRVILLTGHSAIEDLNQATRLGVDHYLVKPVEIDDLLRFMQKPIGRESNLCNQAEKTN